MTEDQKFDRMLEESLSDLPLLESTAIQVTPWKTAMERIVIGLVLTTITLNFLYLQYILPPIGIVSLWLGFRTLRNENGWFTACWTISLWDLARCFVQMTMNATIWGSSTVLQVLTYVSLITKFIQVFCLWRGIKAVRRAAGQPDGAGAAGALVFCTAMIGTLAVINVSGWWVWLLLIGYGFILYCLSKVSKLLDGVGYEIAAAPVRISDSPAKIGYFAALCVCILAAMLLGSCSPMEWTPAAPQEQVGLESVREQLLDLGFPKHVLDDLTPQDLAELDDAVDVYVTQNRYTETWDASSRIRYAADYEYERSGETPPEKPDLVLTSIAVQLPQKRWVAFHHFEWLTPPPCRGTACMELWPTSHISGGQYYSQKGPISGRLLYDENGVTYTGAYWLLEQESYTYDSMFWGATTNDSIFAAYSPPRTGEHCRGYVAYRVEETTDILCLFSSWINYTFQTNWYQYPAQTAMDHAKSGAWNSRYSAFYTIQDAVQFYPGEETTLS